VAPDTQLVVTFHSGKTVNVEKDKAVWIPHDLHERIAFELNLPKNVRKEFAERDRYPQITQSGYPSSGPFEFPLEFDSCPLPTWIPNGGTLALNAPPPYGKSHTWDPQNSLEYYRRPGSREGGSAVKSSDMEKLIPGTGMTREELNKRVMSQITDNMSLLERKEEWKEERNSVENELKKSVSFANHVSQHDVKGGHSDGDLGAMSDFSLSDYDLEATSDAEDASRSRHRVKLLHKRGHTRPRSTGSWRYWKNEPSPSLKEPMHYGPYREGPFKGCMEMPSFLREGNKNYATS